MLIAEYWVSLFSLSKFKQFKAAFRIRMFLGLPDPLVQITDPDPESYPDPYQNVTDPQHWFKGYWNYKKVIQCPSHSKNVEREIEISLCSKIFDTFLQLSQQENYELYIPDDPWE